MGPSFSNRLQSQYEDALSKGSGLNGLEPLEQDKLSLKRFENPYKDFGKTHMLQQIWKNISPWVLNAFSTTAEKDLTLAMEFTTIFGHVTNYAIMIQDFLTSCLKPFHVKMNLSNAVTTRVKRTNKSAHQSSMSHKSWRNFDALGVFVRLTLALTWIRNKFTLTKSKWIVLQFCLQQNHHPIAKISIQLIANTGLTSVNAKPILVSCSRLAQKVAMLVLNLQLYHRHKENQNHLCSEIASTTIRTVPSGDREMSVNCRRTGWTRIVPEAADYA